MADNTLVIFASDNGFAHYVGARVDGRGQFEAAMEPQGHYPSAGFRGYKSDAWDGGHHMYRALAGRDPTGQKVRSTGLPQRFNGNLC